MGFAFSGLKQESVSTRPTPRALLLTVFFLALFVRSAPVNATNWPAEWLLLNVDPGGNEGGINDDIDVNASYFNFDASSNGFLFLRMNTFAAPGFNDPKNFYKWFIDVNGDARWTGRQVVNTEYLLFLADWCDSGGGNGEDGVGELYLLNSSDGEFGEPEYQNCKKNQGCTGCAAFRINNTAVGDYRLLGSPDNDTDTAVNWSKIGGYSLNKTLWWCTGSDAASNPNKCGRDGTSDGEYPFLPIIGVNAAKNGFPSSVYQGNQVNYSLRFNNTGHFSLNVTVNDSLPAGFSYVSGSGSQTPDYVSGDGRTIVWSVANVPANSSRVITFNASVALNATPGQAVNWVFVNASRGGADAVNASASFSVTVLQNSCGIMVSPDAMPFGSVQPGETSNESSVNVSNQGNANASIVVRGFDWMSGGDSLSVSATHFAVTQGVPYDSMSVLHYSDSFLFDLAGGQSRLVYFRLRIPSGQNSGNYSQSILLTSAC